MKHIGLKWELVFICILLVTIPTTLMGIFGYFSYQTFAKEALESKLHDRSLEMHSLAYDFIAQKDRVLRREEALVLKRIKSVAQLSKKILETYPVALKPQHGDSNLHQTLQELTKVRLNRSGHIFLLDDNYQPIFNKTFLQSYSATRIYPNFISQIKAAIPLLISGDIVIIRYPWKINSLGVHLYRQTALAYLENWHMVLGVTINETDYKSEDLEKRLQNELRERISKEQIGELGYTWVFNSEGEYIVSKDRLRDGENMSDITDQHGRSLVKHMISEAIQQPAGDSKIVYYQWRNLGEAAPQPRAVALTYVPEWDWVIGASANLQEFYAGLREIRDLIFYICAIFILLGSIITYLFARMITQPIQHLEQLAVQAADGNLNVSVDNDLTSQHSEISSLSRAFAVMIQNLRSLIEQKEQNSLLLEKQNDALHESEQKLKRAMQQLEIEKQKFHTQAITDPLTNLLNRRGFSIAGNKEWKRHLRTGEPLTIAMIDIDLFKRINDQYGHAAGDDVLIQLASTLLKSMRASDLVARIGGEEFAMIINQPLKEAAKGLERLRVMVEQSPTTADGIDISYTISIGAIEVDQQHISLESALDAADNRLYAAKRRGRNRLVF